MASAAANMRLLDQLGTILRAMHAADVPVIPLKGACLAETVYGDIALRPMTDIDLLVRSRHTQKALSILEELGYGARYAFEPTQEESISQHMPPLSKPRGLPVELHWTLVNPSCGAQIGDGELEAVWSRAVPAAIAGIPARVLSPEDLLLHLCMHASVQHWFADVGLRAFVDIAEVMRKHSGTLEWAEFTARANRWAVSNGVRMTLTLAREWTDVTVPDAVWAELDGALPDGQSLAWARHKVLEGVPTALSSDFVRMESGAGMTGKLSVLRDALFPPRAVMARIYGARTSSWPILAYYPYRLWDLWTRYRGALWMMLRRNPAFVDQSRQEAQLRAYLGWQ